MDRSIELSRYQTYRELVTYAEKVPVKDRPEHLKDLEQWLEKYRIGRAEWLEQFKHI